MSKKHLCPFCSYPLLCHVHSGRPYWFCIHCHQEMPYGICQEHPTREKGQELPTGDRRVSAIAPQESTQDQDLETALVQPVEAIAQPSNSLRNLNDILNNAALKVQQYLQTDRVVICQLADNGHISVIAESLVPGWKTMLDTRLDHLLSYGEMEKFRQGKIQTVEDIYQVGVEQYPVKQLEAFFGVKAKLAIAIRPVGFELNPFLSQNYTDLNIQLEGNLQSTPTPETSQVWGLLIAHQCSEFRQWKQSEIAVFSLMAKQLAIAIQQYQLAQQLQSVNQQLQCLTSVHHPKPLENCHSLKKEGDTATSIDLLRSYVAYFISRGKTLKSPLSGSLPFAGLVYDYWGYHKDFQEFWEQLQQRSDFGQIYIIGDIYSFDEFLKGSFTINECALCRLPKVLSCTATSNSSHCSLCNQDRMLEKSNNESKADNFEEAPKIARILAMGTPSPNCNKLKEWFLLNRFEVTFVSEPAQVACRVLPHSVDMVLIYANISERLAQGWAQQLRRHPQLQEVPIVALSAKAGYGLPWIERNLRIEDYLLIPLSGEHLAHRLRQLSELHSSTETGHLYWFPG
ncbi:MAG TPA: hypothetical protein DDZ80_29750 [Cyanobacteria bacterium UBA8803]|nr:hypothetical protein [Cyanobacteria bacterium UBA9273]HBL62426.1 hypothetical protein [Cyanobacteria bacterium UBA8803]